ncbi:LpqN [Mycolicibacterium aurum]|uniref:LpqN n=1 Tax=Mycolicibacterium aurum TaxID=1791 RepID=A0A448IYK5_MYCAU|nr:LpqN/LpqT family lipoprotein [Mycolicibacterium aurum]VEG57524.1 LpqN [Mycolicibacterium aurum]
MTIVPQAGLAAIAAVALGIGLSGCSSGSSGEGSDAAATSTTTSESVATSAAPTPTTPPPAAAAPGMTIEQYAAENGIVATPVLQGDPGAPTITLPLPQGWESAGPRGPEGAYDALIYTAPPPSPTPPTIVAVVTKLTGNVDPAKILELAPNETRNLPDYEGAEAGKPTNLSGFDATQIGGFYTKDGVKLLVAQKTVVIPAEDGLFVLKITAEGSEEQAYPLMDATASIDEQTTITP